MFQLLPCSNCQRTFSLRKEVPDGALLKCPNCGNQFQLGDVLDAFYAPWIVLDDTPANASPQEATLASSDSEQPLTVPAESRLSFDNLLNTHASDASSLSASSQSETSQHAALLAHGLSSDSDDRLSNALTDDVSEIAADNVFDDNDLEIPERPSIPSLHFGGVHVDDGLELDESLDVVEGQTIGTNQYDSPVDERTPSPTFVTKPRSRRRERSGIWSVIQVILGGAAAIPVTLLLLWHVVGKDVMDAGPTIAQFAPWIVPQKFHHPVELIPIQRDGPRVPPPALGEGGFRNFDEELGSNPAPTEDKAPPEPQEAAAGSNSADAASADAASANAASANAASANAADMSPASADESGMGRVLQTMNKVKSLIDQWDPQATDKSTRATGIFNELVDISVQLVDIPAQAGATRLLKDNLREIGRSIANDKDLRSYFFASIAGQFNPATAPPSAGRVYLDIAREVVETDKLWIINNKTDTYHVMIEVSKQDVPVLKEQQRFFCLATANDDESPTEKSDGAPKMVRVSATFFQSL